jgi:serine/threonine protein kinase
VHRDLKPENMFYMNRNIIKLIDFGSTLMVDQPEMREMRIDDHPKRNKLINFVGTPQYMAPE